jgi:hypothetical protein
LQVVLDDFGAIGRASRTQISAGHPDPGCRRRSRSTRTATGKPTATSSRSRPAICHSTRDIIRAGEAEIYLFQTDSLETSFRVPSRKDPVVEPDPGGTRPRSPTDSLALDVGTWTSRDQFTVGRKPMIAGLFDRSQLELSEDGKWVTINGQDYTAFLASVQWKPDRNGQARRIPTGKRVDLLIEDLLGEADPGSKLQVDVRGIRREELPIVGASEVHGNRRGIAVEQQTSYWDVIYKIAERYALICFVDGLDVVLTRPKTISDKNTSNVKRLAWGQNLESLRLEREHGREQTPTIQVKSYDPTSRQTITVEYPENTISDDKPLKAKGTHTKAHTTEKHRVTPATHSVGKQVTTLRKRDEYQVIPAYGITDRAVLRQMAINRYHLIGRAERKVIAKTRDLRDMRESDLLDLTAGDAVTIDWDEFNRELLASPALPEAEKVEHLVARATTAQSRT